MKYTFSFSIVFLLGITSLYFSTNGFQTFTEEAARRLHAKNAAPAIPAYTLNDMSGKNLSIGQQAQPNRKIDVVGFIYTSCPTICKTAGDDFAVLANKFKQAGLEKHVRLLSVSFDPERDTPQNMQEYARWHKADGKIWTIARPRPLKVDSMLQNFGIRVIPDEWGGYQHNIAIHLIDPKGRLFAIFDTDDYENVLKAVQERL